MIPEYSNPFEIGNCCNYSRVIILFDFRGHIFVDAAKDFVTCSFFDVKSHCHNQFL